MSITDSQKPIVAIDLFCGAGGFSEALDRVGNTLGRVVFHAGVNHNEAAISSYKANRDGAICYNRKAQALNPQEVLHELLVEVAYSQCDDPEVGRDEIEPVDREDVEFVLTAGPQCTAFSQASGGKPDPSNQPRVSAFEVLTWLNQAPPDVFALENVGGIRRWGPVVDDEFHDDGAVFNQWVNTMSKMGFSIDWEMLEAADFGDPTSRERFILLGQKDGTVTFPEPTHDDSDPNKPDRRTAAEIIDWEDLGTSIWNRHKENSRVTPPASTTFERIAAGLRQHCSAELEPFADVLETFDPGTVHTLRDKRVVPQQYVSQAIQALESPFLVQTKQGAEQESGYSLMASGNQSGPATTSTYLLRQQDQYGSPVDVTEQSTPTVTASGGHQIVTPEVEPLVVPRNQWARGTHSNPLYPVDSQPLHTVTAQNHDGHLATPSLLRLAHREQAPGCGRPTHGSKSSTTTQTAFIDDCQGDPKPLDEPLNTQLASERFSLVVPELVRNGLNVALDVKYRMLKPVELKMAQGFDADFELKGTKSERTAQVGNAVPVNMARAVLLHALSDDSVSLAAFGGGIQETNTVSLPNFETFRSRT